jgi:hypothetical protein
MPALHKGVLRCVLTLLACLAASTPYAQSGAVVQASVVSAADVATAMQVVKRDPNISGEKKQRILRWRSEPDTDSTPSSWSQWWASIFEWIYNLFVWIADSSRLLAWLLVALLAGLLLVLVIRVVRRFEPGVTHITSNTPTHIQNLDIRPESLPDDIGTAALALWQQGGQRDALALLYRGMLSRLVNVHQVPIKSSSTEDECVQLSQPRLNSTRMTYVDVATRIWQQAVYGGQFASDATVTTLCTQFADALGTRDAERVSP